MKTQALIILTLMLAPGSLVQAQGPAETLDELQARLRVGDKVQVVDRMGKKTEGKFEGVSAASLRLIVDGARQEFQATEIREVTKRRPESRWDGALIGLGIGAAVGFVTVRSHCSGASEREDCLSVGMAIILPIFAGGGAGSGALIDSAIKKRDTVFAPASRSSYRFRFSPVLDGQRKGVALSVGF